MPHFRALVAAALAALTLAATATQAGTLHVPGQYPTIQAAIDAAIDGDIVELADGVYTGAGNKNLDFGGRAITVRSASGDPTLCIIDCEQDGRGFQFNGREGPDSIIQGLTITNGDVTDYGGAVFCYNRSSPALIDCALIANRACDRGGGLYCSSSSSDTLITS
ncbi:MAG: hypothetical protein ACF8NJ_06250, partial [Phycisphaerales bacterium JB038]